MTLLEFYAADFPTSQAIRTLEHPGPLSVMPAMTRKQEIIACLRVVACEKICLSCWLPNLIPYLDQTLGSRFRKYYSYLLSGEGGWKTGSFFFTATRNLRTSVSHVKSISRDCSCDELASIELTRLETELAHSPDGCQCKKR